MTREEVAVAVARIYRYLHQDAIELKKLDFADSSAIKDWAKESVQLLYTLGWIGQDEKGDFNPKQKVTRAEMAKIIACLMEIQ